MLIVNKQEIINEVIKIEGGYVNDPSDSGGKTKYGITKATARANGYNGSIRNITKSTAYDIYEKKYWNALRLDSIFDVAPKTAEKMFDIGVNAGKGRAGKWLQESLNALNHKNRYGKLLAIDGDVGNQTLGVLNKFIQHRGSRGDVNLTKMLNSHQGYHYMAIANNYSKNKKFTYGWIDNRVS